MPLILIITTFVYIGMVIATKHRTSIALLGSGLLLMAGAVYNLFDVNKVFADFPSEIVILIIVLSLYTDAFEELGLINFIGHKFVVMSNKNRALIMISLPFIMYLTSLFMNNLTVILLFTHMSLYLTIEYNLRVIPVLVSIIIGSNIGGAALPWADTPAVILTLYTDFNFLDFLTKLFIPCAVFAILLSYYTYKWYKYFSYKPRELPFKHRPHVHWKKLSPVMLLFIMYIVFIIIGPFINLSIAYTSLFFGGILLLLDNRNSDDVLNRLPILDSISFLIALFLIGSVLEQSGILNIAAQYIMGLTNNNTYLITLSVLFLAFIIATFLSAGPATATLLPICTELAPTVPFKLIYAALALGILAGSSMLPWSATGGPILFSQINNFLRNPNNHVDGEERRNIDEIYHLRKYIAFSIPFSLVILLSSSVYLAIYINLFE